MGYSGGGVAQWGEIGGILSDQTDLDTRLKVSEEQWSYYEVYDSKSTASGAVTLPTDAEILTGRYSEGGSALCVELDSNGRPIDEVARTSDGTVITVSSFDTLGNYTLSDTPNTTPFAIVYQIRIQHQYSNNVDSSSIVLEFENTGPEYENETGYLYISGRDGVEDSQRFSVDIADGVAQIEKYSEGLWTNTEMKISYGTLYLGHNLALSAAGTQFITEEINGQDRRLYAYTEYAGEEASSALRTVHLDPTIHHFIVQSDNSTERVGTSIEYEVNITGLNILSEKVYFKIGSVDATSYVQFEIFEGSGTSGTKKFLQKYPPSKFTKKTLTISSVSDSPTTPGTARFTLASSTDMWDGQEVTNSGFTTNTDYNTANAIVAATNGSTWYEISGISFGTTEEGTFFTRETYIDTSNFVEAEEFDQDTFLLTSAGPFSLQFNAGDTLPWLVSDFNPAYYENALITEEWVENYPTTVKDWFISHNDRKIYSANYPQMKGPTFSADSRYWNELSPFIFSWETLPSTQDLLIPEDHQMTVNGLFTMGGDLHLEGTLVIR